MVWRLKADGGPGAANGALDHTFGKEGVAELSAATFNVGDAAAIQPDGKTSWSGRTSSVTNTKISSTRSRWHPTAKIVLAGSTRSGSNNEAMVWRMKANGGSGATNDALDPTFDTDGAAAIDGGGFASAGAVALQPDGKPSGRVRLTFKTVTLTVIALPKGDRVSAASKRVGLKRKHRR